MMTSLQLLCAMSLVATGAHPGGLHGPDEGPPPQPGVANPTFLQLVGETHSPAGTRRAITLTRDRLLRPPGRVDGEARSTCIRYLPRVAATLLADEQASCSDRLDAQEVLAMCLYLNKRMADARATVGTMALDRCAVGGAKGGAQDGFSRAVALARRWIWPEIVRPVVEARVREASPSQVDARRELEALDHLRRLRAAISKSLRENQLSSGVVVSRVPRSSVGSGAGLRVGDVILNVGRRPVRDGAELREAASGGNTTVVFLRAGKRKQGLLKGQPKQLEVLPIPEQLLP